MIRFVQTTFACPEQYEAFEGERLVGYLRLRHGDFSVRCPDVTGERVYEADLGKEDGFVDDDQRDRYLRLATEAIRGWQRGQGHSGVAASDTEFEVATGLHPSVQPLSRKA